MTLFLLPSLAADARAAVFSADGRERSLPTAAYAAACFLVQVRGLPLSECEVEIGGKIYTCLFSENGGKCELLVEKCKQLYENNRVFCHNIELEVKRFLDGRGEILLLPTEDDERVPAASLRSLILPESGGLSMACALSVKAWGVSVRYLDATGTYGAPLRCACPAALLGMRRLRTSAIRASVADSRLRDSAPVELFLRCHGDKLAVSAVQAPAPLTLMTPLDAP